MKSNINKQIPSKSVIITKDIKDRYGNVIGQKKVTKRIKRVLKGVGQSYPASKKIMLKKEVYHRMKKDYGDIGFLAWLIVIIITVIAGLIIVYA